MRSIIKNGIRNGTVHQTRRKKRVTFLIMNRRKKVRSHTMRRRT